MPWGKGKELDMIVTTTPTIEGHKILAYKGIVVGEAIMGANIVRDIFANITDVIGGRSGAYESKLQDARDTALAEMQEKPWRWGAMPWWASIWITRLWASRC